MLLTYRLPGFLDYLSHHYQRLYTLYSGRCLPAAALEKIYWLNNYCDLAKVKIKK
jgi:hypothetical protein